MLKIYGDIATPLQTYQLFKPVDGIDKAIFTLTVFPGQDLHELYKIDDYPVKLSLPEHYTVSGNTITLTTALTLSQTLAAIPVGHLALQFDAGLNDTVITTQRMSLQRNSEHSYRNINILSKDLSKPQLDFSAEVYFNNATGFGFTGLIPNSLIGCAVIHDGSYRGIIASNTETTIKLAYPSYYTGELTTAYIYSIANCEFAVEMGGSPDIFYPVLSLAAIETDEPFIFWFKDTTVIKAFAPSIQQTIQVLGDEVAPLPDLPIVGSQMTLAPFYTVDPTYRWGEYGKHIQLSADGNTMVAIAGPTASIATKFITTHTKTAGVWSSGTAVILRPPEHIVGSNFDNVFLSSDGQLMVVGNPYYAVPHYEYGNAYVYARDANNPTGWTFIQLLSYPDAPGSGRFGEGLAISADNSTILVGAANVNRIYTFYLINNVWTNVHMIKPAVQWGGFSRVFTLSSDGKTLVVPTDIGSRIYTFELVSNTWIEQPILVLSNTDQQDLGWCAPALSADKSLLVISAPGNSSFDLEQSGCIYICTKSNNSWIEQQIFRPYDAAPLALFGSSLALSADKNTLLVSARSADYEFGKVYTLKRNEVTWTAVNKLEAIFTAEQQYYFGYCIASTPDLSTVAVGAIFQGGEIAIFYGLGD